MATNLNDYYQYQVAMGFMTQDEAEAEQAKEDAIYGDGGAVHTKIGGGEVGNGITPQQAQNINNSAAEYKSFSDDFDATQKGIRDYAKGLIEGKGMSTLDDYYKNATMGLDRSYSQKNSEMQSAMAAGGAAGSGFQKQGVQDMKADKAMDFSKRRAQALNDYNKTKFDRETTGWNLLQGASDSENRRRALDESDREARTYKF
jgi:hypothetical protein